MRNDIYTRAGLPIGFHDGNHIYDLQGRAVGQLCGSQAFCMAGHYIGELRDGILVDKNRNGASGAGKGPRRRGEARSMRNRVPNRF